MYILFISLFVLGLEMSYYLFLLTYVILIPYQEVINNMEWNVSRISAYIRTFYEESDPNLNWEYMNAKYPKYLEYLERRVRGLSGFVRNAGSIHLGFLATAFFIGSLLQENCDVNTRAFNLNLQDILLILFSVVMFFITILINQDSKTNQSELERIMTGYREYVIERNSGPAEEQVSCQKEPLDHRFD